MMDAIKTRSLEKTRCTALLERDRCLDCGSTLVDVWVIRTPDIEAFKCRECGLKWSGPSKQMSDRNVRSWRVTYYRPPTAGRLFALRKESIVKNRPPTGRQNCPACGFFRDDETAIKANSTARWCGSCDIGWMLDGTIIFGLFVKPKMGRLSAARKEKA